MTKVKVYKILLLEDDESSAKLLLHTLERYNFDVTHVIDGMAGLIKIRNNSYDLIISDIMMPNMDGISVLERGNEHLKNTPIILLTSVGEKETVVRAAHVHVSAYLLKPIATNALLEKIAQLLQLKPEMIVDKKLHPLVVKFTELSVSQLVMNIEGCPGKKSLGEMYEKFSHFLAGRGTFTNLRINIGSEFFLETTSLKIMDELIGKILKNTNIRPNSLFLDSNFFRETVSDLTPYSHLSEVNIISK